MPETQTLMPGWQHDRRSRHERGYGAAWDKLRKIAMDRDGWLCQPCQSNGRVTPATECDHVRPKSQGGADDLDNLQAICATCHAEKSKAERAQANGHRVKPQIGQDGWPVE